MVVLVYQIIFEDLCLSVPKIGHYSKCAQEFTPLQSSFVSLEGV